MRNEMRHVLAVLLLSVTVNYERMDLTITATPDVTVEQAEKFACEVVAEESIPLPVPYKIVVIGPGPKNGAEVPLATRKGTLNCG
jgi:hypothetical protein